MKLSALFGFLAVFLIATASSFAVGMAMPPSKLFESFIGDELSIDILLINEEGIPADYFVSFSGDLKDRATANPSAVKINPPLNVPHRGNPAEDGIAKVHITINSTDITPGTYTLDVSTSVSRSGDGVFNIIQKVTRGIKVKYEYPPSFFNKFLNAIYSGFKNIIDWTVGTLKNFYHNNRWLDYLFITAVLVAVFYVGTKTNDVLYYLAVKKKAFSKELEKIQKYGLLPWASKKIKNMFKKEQVHTEGRKDDGQEKGPENSD